MVSQYPHFLFVKTATESTQDGDGNWSTPTEGWVFHSMCREQPNGNGSTLNGPDGKAIIYASTIHLPLTALRIEEGVEVLVSNSNDATGLFRIKGQVRRFDPGQLHSRLWV